MSILCSCPEGYVISHELLIKRMYENVSEDENAYSLSFHSSIFKILDEFVEQQESCKRQKKRKVTERESEACQLEISHIKRTFKALCDVARKQGLLVCEVSDKTHNEEAKRKAEDFYKKSSEWKFTCFSGANSYNFPVIKSVNRQLYVFPENSTFFCYDVKVIEEKIDTSKEKFDLILFDPPWWNKYIRRKKAKNNESSYQMMYNDELKKLPIASLLATDSLVAVWCTNSQQNLNALLEEIFPVWGVKYVGTWFWVKVTQYGELIRPFADPPGKQPYERIIFGHNSEENRVLGLPQDGKLIVSVPSALHSHKPPLSGLLSPYLPSQPKCLELFARYLLPNWTSWGDEVLKLQHISLYEKSTPNVKPEC